MFIVLLSSIANASNHTKCVLLSNPKYEIQPALINLHPNEFSQEFHYYPFVVKIDRRAASYNTLSLVPNKTDDLNLSVFNMIIGIKAPKTLANHISCE